MGSTNKVRMICIPVHQHSRLVVVAVILSEKAVMDWKAARTEFGPISDGPNFATHLCHNRIV